MTTIAERMAKPKRDILRILVEDPPGVRVAAAATAVAGRAAPVAW